MFDVVINYIQLLYFQEISELQLHAITSDNVIKVQLITITITPTLTTMSQC